MNATAEADKFLHTVIDLAIQRLQPQRIILFGSRARGDHNRYSDYDIAIEAIGVPKVDWVRFVLDIQEDLDTSRRVDLVRLETADPVVRYRIEQEGKVLWHAW